MHSRYPYSSILTPADITDLQYVYQSLTGQQLNTISKSMIDNLEMESHRPTFGSSSDNRSSRSLPGFLFTYKQLSVTFLECQT